MPLVTPSANLFVGTQLKASSAPTANRQKEVALGVFRGPAPRATLNNDLCNTRHHDELWIFIHPLLSNWKNVSLYSKYGEMFFMLSQVLRVVFNNPIVQRDIFFTPRGYRGSVVKRKEVSTEHTEWRNKWNPGAHRQTKSPHHTPQAQTSHPQAPPSMLNKRDERLFDKDVTRLGFTSNSIKTTQQATHASLSQINQGVHADRPLVLTKF